MAEIDIARQYLLDYLHEEFDRYPGVRLRAHRRSSKGDDDPGDDGIFLKTETREYYFETEWVRRQRMREVETLVTKVKDFLEK